ncbi:hypothetical protein M9H77_17175 [Catharanthus roseus]|uniref:Uncharacterized protein n=1 Tax=Catharanthus roseus TaxID=4058 RepID=A0ACC0B3V4_CATRO|nr:hypothetical protein M9H77_17175 [Catharanthus roseus]
MPTRCDWVSLWTGAQIGVSAHFVLPYRRSWRFLVGMLIGEVQKRALGNDSVEERVEELQENSAVAETSLLVSRTLGMEDSPSSAKEPLVDDGVESQPKKMFASLFVDNRNPSGRIQLYKVRELPDMESRMVLVLEDYGL